MFTCCVTLPLQVPLGFIAIESGSVSREVKNEVPLSIAVYVLDVTAVNRSGATSLADDFGSTKSVADILACRVEVIRLEDCDRDESVTTRVNCVLFAPGLDIDTQTFREMSSHLPTQRSDSDSPCC